jgi:hypothetical protein
MARFDLTDAEWEIIAPLLPKAQDRPQGGRPTQGDRRVLNGIFFVLRTGHTVARSAGALRSVHDGIQPLQSLGQARHLVADLRDLGGKVTAVVAIDR